MIHKDIYAFTTTFLLFFLVAITLKIVPTELLVSHHNVAKQKISLDFVTVKQLVCQVEPKVSHKKPLTKTVTKLPKKTAKKVIKKKIVKKVVKKVTKTVAKKVQTVKVSKKVVQLEKKKLEQEKLLKEAEEKERLEELAKLAKAKQRAIEQERVRQIAAAQLAQERNIFLTSIKKKINENKRYPRMAKRRNIEGSTHISFTIFKNGSIKIHHLKGNKLFYKKSKQALMESFPIEIPSKIRSTFPLQLNIDLKYALS